jgi:hypothetical protein
MPPTAIPDPDPYAELDYRADAGELSEEYRKPVRVNWRTGRPQPASRPELSRSRRRAI